MFVGHAALALGVRPRVTLSLGVLFAAVFGLDLLWPTFLLLGIEHVTIPSAPEGFSTFVFDHYPWSHSLVMALMWSLAAAALTRLLTRASGVVAALVGMLVFSHWVLDCVTHLPDLPLWPGESPLVGLGLWRSVTATIVVEGTLYLSGIVLYFRGTRARDATGRYGLIVLLLLCAVMWVSTPFGPPPPSAGALAWFAEGLWLLVIWAAWADRHRELAPLRELPSR